VLLDEARQARDARVRARAARLVLRRQVLQRLPRRGCSCLSVYAEATVYQQSGPGLRCLRAPAAGPEERGRWQRAPGGRRAMRRWRGLPRPDA